MSALRFTLLVVILATFLGPLAAPPALANSLPASAAATATVQCFYPEADTYTDSYAPGTNFGDAVTLRVASIGDQSVLQQWSFLRFDLAAIPTGSTVLSADLQLFLTSAPYGGRAMLKAAESNWTEYGLTYNNQPSVSAFTYDDISWGVNTTGWRTWQADQLVNEWVTGTRTNRGLVVMDYGVGTAPSEFHSREGSSTRNPRLCVEWTTSLSTDIVINEIEVTQAVQDLNNSVRLVAGKQTYVRVHANSTGSSFRTFATLTVSRGSDSVTLYPQNPGAHIIVRTDPMRARLDDAFLFQLPSRMTGEGSLTLRAEVNPIIPGWRTSRYPPETSYTNNIRTTTVQFETVPQLSIIMYRGNYTLDTLGTTITHTTPITDLYQARSWMERAFPLSYLWMTVRVHDFGAATLNPDRPGHLATPNSGTVNQWLASKRTWDLNEASWYESYVGKESEIRYYAMLINTGGFMRGAMGSRTGSGPTGAIGGWDADGRFGDWYAGHEIGHSLGRAHVQGDAGGAAGACGGEDGADPNYPHNRGFISTDTTGANALFGFDIGTRFQPYGLIPQQARVYDARWRDMMTYCGSLWISDYTSEGIMDYMQANVTPSEVAAAGVQAGEQTNRLLVVGTIDPETGATALEPLFVIPNAHDVAPRTPGDYVIVLRSSGGSELARYPFTPEEVHSGPSDPAPGATPAPEVDLLLISELVPYVTGTDRVDIEGPGGTLATVTAGSTVPTITLLSPNGGETFSGDTIPVSWSASDADGDPLAFTVQFSRDNGLTWEVLAQNITGNSVSIPRENVPTTNQGLFRVWVSDGIHTASDTSNGPFTTTLRNPEVKLLSPSEGLYVAANQTLNLEALAYSPNIGTLSGGQVTWSSSLDGPLAQGEAAAVTGLTPGVHAITVTVNDGSGTSSETVNEVVVVSDPRYLPTPDHRLVVGPAPLLFWPGDGITEQTLRISNASGTNAINWAALEFLPWLSLSRTSGNTPDEITVTVNAAGLAPGLHEGTIGFFSSGATRNTFLDVVLSVTEREAPMACQARSTFDFSDDGWLRVNDATAGVAIPDHEKSGGNPGGYILATNGTTGGVGYWQAPGKFLGDQSCAYGKALTFDLRQTGTGSPLSAPDVLLIGESLTLAYNTAANPGTAWTSIRVDLTEDAGWVKAGTAAAPTRAEFEQVLATLEALHIRSEYRTGAGTVGLDNVALAATDGRLFLPLVIRR